VWASVEIHAELEFPDAGGRVRAKVVDLSLCGALIELADASVMLVPDQRLFVELGAAEQRVRLRGVGSAGQRTALRLGFSRRGGVEPSRTTAGAARARHATAACIGGWVIRVRSARSVAVGDNEGRPAGQVGAGCSRGRHVRPTCSARVGGTMLTIVDLRVQQLHRDGAIELLVVAPIHDAHRAAPVPMRSRATKRPIRDAPGHGTSASARFRSELR